MGYVCQKISSKDHSKSIGILVIITRINWAYAYENNERTYKISFSSRDKNQQIHFPPKLTSLHRLTQGCTKENVLLFLIFITSQKLLLFRMEQANNITLEKEAKKTCYLLCCMSQGTQTRALWPPRGVGKGRRWEGGMYGDLCIPMANSC